MGLIMSVEVSVNSAKKNLEDILAKLSPGETATLIGPEGRPMAVLVPLRSSEDVAAKIDWDEEWQALAQEIDLAWKSEKSALEILAEMRR
jgi:antitoxin (DNA-binding transcriptional repressor) of toxin-antitoxin stability system